MLTCMTQGRVSPLLHKIRTPAKKKWFQAFSLVTFLLVVISYFAFKGRFYFNIFKNHERPILPPPNIVFILADDLGWNDVGYHGSEIKTPNIDKLAKTGVKLENYYVQQVCTPSRAALLSGRYPIRTGLQHECIYVGQRTGLPLYLKTLANQLQDRGYNTHGVGKWHLGYYHRDFLPTQRGFDSWTGYLGGHSDYYNHSNCMSLGCGYDFYENNTLDTSDNTTYSTLRYTQKAKEIIMGHVTPGTDDKGHVTSGTDEKGHVVPRSKPLFLYLPFQAVHSPLQVPESYIEPYKHTALSPDRQIFAGMMSCLDEAVGNITSYLKANRMWNNTILIFSSDNGGDGKFGASNLPLRGEKWTLWEGGLRGVSFIHSPLFESSTVGTVHKSLMHISDWYPTIVEGILNDTLPSTLSIDGVNMWDSLRTGRQGPRTELLHTIDPLDTHPDKSVYDNTFPSNVTAAIRVGDWKLITGNPERKFINKKQNIWLFNITQDPIEKTDVSKKFPQVVKALLDKLLDYSELMEEPNFPEPDPAGLPPQNRGVWGPWVHSLKVLRSNGDSLTYNVSRDSPSL